MEEGKGEWERELMTGERRGKNGSRKEGGLESEQKR